MVLSTGLRFYAYSIVYQRQHRPPFFHTPVLGQFFASMVVVFGVAVVVILLVLER